MFDKGRIKTILSARMDYPSILAAVWAVISVRVVIEFMVFEFPVELGFFQDRVRFFLENTYYFLILFLAGTVFISRITRLELRRVMNFCARLYVVIILPPLIDRFIFGNTAGYNYAGVENLLVNFLTLFGGADASPGIFIELILGVFGASAYVFWVTRSILKSAAAFLFLDAVLLILSTPDIFFGPGGGDCINVWFLPLFYFVPFPVLILAAVGMYSWDKLKAILRNARWIRAFSFVAAVMLGVYFSVRLTGILAASNVFLGALAVFFLWETAVALNDLSDISIDRISNPSRPLPSGAVRPSEYVIAAFLCAFVALSFAVISNQAIFSLSIAGLFLAYGYSVPPVRWRRTLCGAVVIGLFVVLCFLIGLLSSGEFVPVGYLLSGSKVKLYAVFIFLIGSLVPLVKDIKDIEGDARHRVSNLFTVFGRRRGKIITVLCIVCAYNFSHFVIGSFNAVIFLGSIAAGIIFYLYEHIHAVYIISILIAAFVLRQIF